MAGSRTARPSTYAKAASLATPRTPWWAWPSVLALDAPTVAVAWLWAVAAELGTHPGWGPTVVMGMSVWLVYTADRLIDARRLAPPQTVRSGARRVRGEWAPTLRHAFAISHRRRLGMAWFSLLALDLTVALALLPASSLLGGLLVLASAALALGRSARADVAALVRRALLVGSTFAGAVAVLVGIDAALGAAPLLGAFALVCAANVTFIARWERALADGVTAQPMPASIPLAMALAAGAASLGLALATGSLAAACVAAAAALLLSLHAASRWMDAVALRIGADVALIVPLALLL